MQTDDVWRVIDDERGRLANLLDDLTAAEWTTPSLCADWTVREVAAHLTLAQMGLGTALKEAIRARGSFNGMIKKTAIRQARLPVTEFSRRIRAMVGSRRTAPFLSEFEPLIDILCHGQDIARPLGRSFPMPAEASAVAASKIWERSFPFRAKRRLQGFELVATDAPWRVGSGIRVVGPAGSLLLLVSGRAAALPDLSGPGAAALPATFADSAVRAPVGSPVRHTAPEEGS